jgi:tripartite-type tricarboxylate transporter receptor subunit TctC
MNSVTVARIACAALAAAAASAAFAQAGYPVKPVRLVVPSSAGGGTDIVARIIAPELTKRLGQQFVIENRAGAGTMIGIEVASKSPPDGYTLLMGLSTLAINSALYKKVPYDPVRDFAPIVHVVNAANVLVVHPSVPASNVGELVALARAKPRELAYASNGSGSSPHLAAEMFATAMGIKLNHIPFKGSAPAVTAMLGGQTQMAFNNAGDVLQHVRAGKLRALAVTGAKRLPALPDAPTMQEVGVPNYEAVAWWGYFAPAGTPRDIVAKLNAQINKAIQVPEVRERLSVQGSAEIVGGTPEQLAAFMKAEIAKWSRVIKESGATAD